MILDVIDLADTRVPSAELADRIGAADAFVVVTPEYNHSYPGPLHAIDSVGEQWRAKPVGFVSYGGVSGGLRAVEPLRVVFAELHAVTIRERLRGLATPGSLARRLRDDRTHAWPPVRR